MHHDKRYHTNPTVSCGDEVDGAVLYNPDTDDTSVVNLSGLELWSFLETPHSISELAEYLLQVYSNVSIEKATEDVELFIKTLLPDFLQEINDAD